MERRKFDVGIVVPLREEFRYVLEVAPLIESISYEGTYFYRLDFGPVTALCCLVGQMGPLPALQAATRLLGYADIKLLVVLGLGGALDRDVAVGDVVVGTEVNEFQANSKAQPASEGYEVRYSGRHWPLPFRIREAISHFEFSARSAFTKWQDEASHAYEKLGIPGKESVCSAPPSLHLGPIASGNVVAASKAFVEEVKRIDRKFVAIDMESAGVAPAAAERIHQVPCLVVRGMSDQSNEGKKGLEEESKGAWRAYAVRNATCLLRSLLGWQGFQDAADLGGTGGTPILEDLASQLAVKLSSCIGAPWLVGVAFGFYLHGPYTRAVGQVVAMDLSRLRALDTRIAKLISDAEKQKERLLLEKNLETAAEQFKHLMEDFRISVNSRETDTLLGELDRVVIEVLSPTKQDDYVASLLLQADKLDEEAGAAAVIDLLKGSVTESPRLRERYVDALAKAAVWPVIVATLEHVELAKLSRTELENGLFACGKTGQVPLANGLMKEYQSRYSDNGAKLFRREMTTNHPEIFGVSK